jgi:hypothetical protein
MRIHQDNKPIRTATPTPQGGVAALPLPILVVLCSLFFLLSCQTAPKIADAVPEEAGTLALGTSLPLDEGASAYIVADVQNAMSILDQTFFGNMKTKQLQQMLDSTSWAMVATFPPHDERRYQLVAWGSYPVSKARMALWFSRDWKKRRSVLSKAEYWFSAKDGLSIALDRRQARLVFSVPGASANPIDPFLAGKETVIPQGFNEFSKGAVLSCWINNPSQILNTKLGEMGIPIEIPAELLFVNVESISENQYRASLRIQVSSAAQARALVSILTIARAFLPSDTGLSNEPGVDSAVDSASVLQGVLFTNPAVQDGNCLNIQTGILSGKEASLLFAMFSL